LGEEIEVAAEVFSHTSEGAAPAQTEASTMIDAGGYYHLRGEGMQLPFAYGHSVAGQTENYAYLGLYWTWGKTPRTPMSRHLRRRKRPSGKRCSLRRH